MQSQWWYKKKRLDAHLFSHTGTAYSNDNIPTSLPPIPTITPSDSRPSWVMRNNEFISDVLSFFFSSTQESCASLSLPSAALPLAVGKWTKAPLNRPMHSVKARGLDLSWRGETQFISAPDQLPAKRTSHPISRRLQHKKSSGGGCGGCKLGAR